MYRKSPYGPAKIMPVGPEIYPLNQCMHLYVNMYSRHVHPYMFLYHYCRLSIASGLTKCVPSV